MIPNNDCYLFIIKTDSYTGNFERQMCSYITGVDNGNGLRNEVLIRNVAISANKIFREECSDRIDEFEDLITGFNDENGWYKCSTVWGEDYKDIAIPINIDSLPTQEQLKFMMDRAIKFSKQFNSKINILGFELREFKVKIIETLLNSWQVNEL